MACNSSEKDSLAVNLEPDQGTKSSHSRNISEDFKDYWYQGVAEITSYLLTQERYGELCIGTSVTVFVTEDFLPKVQVKANEHSEENIPVLKLNTIKKYLTGIYPYSVMTSTFSPVNTTGHAIKITHSTQEWLGFIGIDRLEGSYFNVMGLPTRLVYKTLMEIANG